MDFHFYSGNWNGYVCSSALGYDTKSKNDDSFWFFAFWVALFS